MSNIFHGTITATVTPFSQERIDFASFEKILDLQVAASIKTVVVGGSTGEITTLENHEYHDLISAALQNKKLNVIAGCNSSSTVKAINIAKQSQTLGVHGLMLVVPPYNKPTQEGMYQHFKEVHDATDLPMMIYSVPSRTGVDFSDETIVRICALERVVAIKDAGGDLMRPLRVMEKIGSNVNILSGDDYSTLAFNAHGAKGLVSVISNLFPELVVKVQNLWLDGKFNEALKLQIDLFDLYKAVFAETNPIGIKYALEVAGLCSSQVRLPLCQLKPESKLAVEREVRKILL
jgi:4-hydroxy-tetrahydrodipicolinate synthase